MRFHIKTYGCQMNVRDSEAAAVLLHRHGHEAVPEEDAQLILVNSCSVRGKAEDKAIGKLGLMVATKRDRPDRIVGVMGCMSQRLGEALFDKVASLDFVVGTHRLRRLPEIVAAVAEGSGPICDVSDEPYEREATDGHEANGVSAFINILLGCDRRCTYCIVPSVRGHEWSRSGLAVVDEARDLVARGVREITLLGQSVMAYGRRNSAWGDGGGRFSFSEPLPRLLESLAGVPGLSRLRFTSGHPSGCTDELARAMADLPPVCEHLHLPLQSGADGILRRMRRGYDADGYREAVSTLRNRVPQIAITTDIIVGFPGETEADFEATRAFMDEIGFDGAFIFKYSPRAGTVAAEWDDDVPAEEKMRRNKVLLDDQDRRSAENHASLVGKCVEVLAEGQSLRNSARWSGRTRTNKITVFEPAADTLPGSVVSVRVERVLPQTLQGHLDGLPVPEGTEV